MVKVPLTLKFSSEEERGPGPSKFSGTLHLHQQIPFQSRKEWKRERSKRKFIGLEPRNWCFDKLSLLGQVGDFWGLDSLENRAAIPLRHQATSDAQSFLVDFSLMKEN